MASTCKHDFAYFRASFTVGDFPFGVQEHLNIPKAVRECRKCGVSEVTERARAYIDEAERKLAACASKVVGD